ncbi:MAG: CocE/NonD family hydrolase, partial [Cyanobium sp.]
MHCRDGTRLLSRIWQPQGQGPWPVLLMRQPYGRAIASTPVLAHPGWWADQGFLVVVQDVRGQGESEGEFGGFQQEASDTTDTVRWARRLPGC